MFLEMLSEVAPNISHFVRKMKIMNVGYKYVTKTGKRLKKKFKSHPLYPGGCFFIDVQEYYNLTGGNSPLQISFQIYNTKDYGAALFIDDRNTALSKRISLESLKYLGPIIENNDLRKILKYCDESSIV